MLEELDYENTPEHSYTFTVEALDTRGTMPPGLASVTVHIVVSLRVVVAQDGDTGEGGWWC